MARTARRLCALIDTWSRGVADQNMAEDILVELAPIIRGHPWWRARAALTMRLLNQLRIRPPARVLDAGCGWGVTLNSLEERGYQANGMDISRRILEQLDRPDRFLIEADITKSIDHSVELYDAVLALDVIEHLDDDRSALRHLGRLTKPGGVVIVSVPALPELFSEFDTIQGHRRRYVPDILRSAFSKSGLDVERVFWWGRWMVPAIRQQRAKPRSLESEVASQVYCRYLKLPPWPLPLIARLAFAIEEPIAVAGLLRSGTSLFAIARRPDIAI